MERKFNKNAHSVHKLTYHLIFVIKYRRKVINDEIFNYLYSELVRIGKSYDINIIEVNHAYDHIHILFEAKPQTDLIKFINVYKTITSKNAKKKFPYIKKYLWKQYFWKRGYCLITTGDSNIDIVKKYIQNQREG